MGFPHSVLSDDEQLVLVLRRHGKVLIGPVAVLILGVAAFAASFLIPAGAQPWATIVVGVVALVVVVRWFAWPFLVWFNEKYAITTRRLIIRRGVLNRSGHDMPLSRLNDVSFEHNVWERMLGCGTLVVESAGERGQLTLDDVPKVELVQRTLYRLADDLRGVHPDKLAPDLARDLDEEFDGEYQGPAGAPRDRSRKDERRT